MSGGPTTGVPEFERGMLFEWKDEYFLNAEIHIQEKTVVWGKHFLTTAELHDFIGVKNVRSLTSKKYDMRVERF